MDVLYNRAVRHTLHHLMLALMVGVVCLLGGLKAEAAGKAPRIAVLELQGKLETEALALLSDKVRAGVLDATSGRKVVVMSRENMAVMAKDMGLDLSCIEGACEVETGRNIGADYVVSGAVTQMSGMWLCTVKIHDTVSGALLSTGDVEAKTPLALRNEIASLVVRLMNKAFGGGGAQSTVQLGGEDVDFAGQAATAGQAAAGGQADVGEATLELGSGGGDIAALVAQAQAKKAERARLAAEEAQLQAQLKAAQDRERDKAKSELLRQGTRDYELLAHLVRTPMSDESVSLLERYVSRYDDASVTVSGQRSSVSVPEVVRVQRALSQEKSRRARVLAQARQDKLQAAREKILAEGARDYATLKPLLGEPASAETRPALQAFVNKYGRARVSVDGVGEDVDVPGVAEVRRTLGLRERARPAVVEIGTRGTRGRGSGVRGFGTAGGSVRTKKKALVRIGGPIILGALDKSLIDRVIKRNKLKILYCYQRELNKNPSLHGKITVNFTISPSGSVHKATTYQTTMANSAVESCINRQLKMFKFPQPKGGGIVIAKYPFIFASG